MQRENIKKISGIMATVFLLFFIFLPILTFAVPSAETKADKTGITYECGDDKTAGECDFADLVEATKKVVDFGTILALEFSVVVIAYAGFNYMISGDNPSKRSEANKMLGKVVIGIIVILLAWLIVTLILGALGVDSIVKLG